MVLVLDPAKERVTDVSAVIGQTSVSVADPVFGRVITAMVTPFTASGAVNYAEARRLAAYLVDEQGNDALVINGTTGEAPTTTDEEKGLLVAAVQDEVGDRAKVIAGVGTNDTSHTIRLAQEAAQMGAQGLLVVTPYYSRPPQHALVAHYTKVADATELPIVLYDIPHRSGVPLEPATLCALAEHPRIVAVKDAKGAIVSSSEVIARTGLQYYAGDDAITLPLMAVGGVGVIGTATHFIGARVKVMMAAFLAGQIAQAQVLNAALLPIMTGVFATQGCMMVKAALATRGFNPGGLRLPMLEASAAQRDTFVALLDAAGV